KSYRLAEAMGAVWFWHDAEGGEPEWELDVLPQWNDPAWVRWKFDHLGELKQHQVEVLDNIADYSHLKPIHGADTTRFENEFIQHRAIQRQCGPWRGQYDADGNTVELTTITTYHGPGLLLSEATTSLSDNIMIITNTPIDDGVIKVWHGLLVKSPSGAAVATEQDAVTARAYQAEFLTSFSQDFEVWGNKEPCLQGMYVAGDGAFRKARVWMKQFFNPRAKREEYWSQTKGIHVPRGKDVQPFTQENEAA
ncbi:MAG: (2Fe-2S)-binding protein, partial [Proteobacteria bacterium]|nr:(2Fe-2S)-binding protein [Pseudomonadota bacterium]